MVRPGQCRVQPGDEGVVPSLIRLNGIGGRKVGRGGGSHHVDVSARVNSQVAAIVCGASTEVGAVDELGGPGGSGIELDHERVASPIGRGVIGIHRGEVGGRGTARQPQLAGPVDGDTAAAVVSAAAEAGRVDERGRAG